jgi:hypothetical protein
VDKWGNTTLHEAMRANSTETMKMLLKAGVPAELKNEKGLCARELAKNNGLMGIVEEHDRIIKEMQTEEEKISKKIIEKDLILQQHEIINEKDREIEKLRDLLEEKNQTPLVLSRSIRRPKRLIPKLSLDDKELDKPKCLSSLFSTVPQHIYYLAEHTKIDLGYLIGCYNGGKPNDDYKRIDEVSYYLQNHAHGKKPSLSKEEVLALSLQESVNLGRCYPLISDGIMEISQAKPLKDEESDNLTGIGLDIVRDSILPLDKVINLSKPTMDQIRENYFQKGLSVRASVTAALEKYPSPGFGK